MGVINVSGIVRSAFRSAYLGYYAFVPHVGPGYMTEGLALALRWAFGGLHLHRVEANIQPGTKHRGSACTRSEICVGGSVVRDREPASRAEPSAAGRLLTPEMVSQVFYSLHDRSE